MRFLKNFFGHTSESHGWVSLTFSLQNIFIGKFFPFFWCNGAANSENISKLRNLSQKSKFDYSKCSARRCQNILQIDTKTEVLLLTLVAQYFAKHCNLLWPVWWPMAQKWGTNQKSGKISSKTFTSNKVSANICVPVLMIYIFAEAKKKRYIRWSTIRKIYERHIKENNCKH